MKKDYYAQKLSAERLRLVYEIASPRIRRYLEAELEFVLARFQPDNRVLELGCGYGRVLDRLAEKSRNVYGLDTSWESLVLAKERHQSHPPFRLALMTGARLGFRDRAFDLTACVQNGISAFKVDRRELMIEALRVTRPGGLVLFSSYSPKIWPERLDWFRAQAAHGLLGEIDEEKTSPGVIVCKDGFQAFTVGPKEFLALAESIGVKAEIQEVDESSVFCLLRG
ncbi:MAG: class I SAM-dependent methyltransferase [Thermodesulfobacteriota bacterium]